MPSAPAHADSVWPAFGLACFLASLLQIRHASLTLYTAFSLPKILVTLRKALPAVETVAESTSDGVIAPMLYTAHGGPVLGMI